jgi:hypothetical protein
LYVDLFQIVLLAVMPVCVKHSAKPVHVLHPDTNDATILLVISLRSESSAVTKTSINGISNVGSARLLTPCRGVHNAQVADDEATRVYHKCIVSRRVSKAA